MRRAGLGAALALACACFFLPIENPDLYWHLSSGRWIVEHGAVPRADWTSHTLAGRPWIDFEWLAQLLFYGAERAGGAFGMLALRLTLLGLTLAALLAQQRRHRLGAAGAALAALWFSASIVPYADLRPDNFSLLFFAALLWALEELRAGRLAFDRRAAAASAVFFCLWSNLHLGFTFGLALIGLYALGERLDAARFPSGTASALARSRGYALLAAAGAGGAALDPYGWRLAEVLWIHFQHKALLVRLIGEWAPLDVTLPLYQPAAALVAAALACLLAHAVAIRSTRSGLILTLAAFAAAASLHRRNIVYAVPAALTALGGLAGELSEKSAARLRTAAVILCLPLAGHISARVLPALPASAAALRPPPPSAGAAAFLEREAAAISGARLYNEVADGDYLGYRLYPRYRIFCDGRYLFTPLLAKLHAAAGSPSSWDAVMDAYGVEIAVVHPSARYREYLPPSKWNEVYREPRYAVLLRR